MYTSELREYLRRDPLARSQLGDVCAADQLPLRPKRSLYVVNTDTSAGPGRHWVAFYFPRGRGPPEFFDPVGLPPETYHVRFRNALILNGPRYVYNNQRLQAAGSTTCGYFCLFYAYFRCRGLGMRRALRKFKNFCSNEEKVIGRLYMYL